MSLLFRVIYAAHANGTHHKLALDALRSLSCNDREAWTKLFLANAELYLRGSKEPDKKFKDFKNHVYHVRDNGWGGAPAKAREWYDKTVDALKCGAFEEAVFNAGVLSHYVTDPIQPFHTAQSEAENAIHRAAEWSISKSYGELKKWGHSPLNVPEASLPEGADFVEALVRQGAGVANEYYEHLIAHYDFDKGVVDPPSGFSFRGQEILAGLIDYAAKSFGLLLNRAIEDANVVPPNIDITAETVIATLKIPVRWVTNKIEDAEDRKLVQAMYDELQATGRVEETLPEDDRTIRDLHRAEVLQNDAAVAKTVAQVREAMDAARETMTATASLMRDVDTTENSVATADDAEAPAASGDQYYLNADQDVEAAPSIGPKTAERLLKADIKTVRDLLAADPEQVAWKVGVGYISANVVKDWQDQAALVCTLPKLRGTQAKLLVGAGYKDVMEIARADPYTMLSAISAFLRTSEGERAMRSGKEPDIELVKEWIERAVLVAPQKAA